MVDCFYVTEGRPSGKILVLGNYDHDQEWSETQKSSKDAKVSHHSQYYTNGTLCDLTGGYRKAEIRVREERRSLCILATFKNMNGLL